MLFFDKPADEFFEDKKKQSGKMSCFQRVSVELQLAVGGSMENQSKQH